MMLKRAVGAALRREQLCNSLLHNCPRPGGSLAPTRRCPEAPKPSKSLIASTWDKGNRHGDQDPG